MPDGAFEIVGGEAGEAGTGEGVEGEEDSGEEEAGEDEDGLEVEGEEVFDGGGELEGVGGGDDGVDVGVLGEGLVVEGGFCCIGSFTSAMNSPSFES